MADQNLKIKVTQEVTGNAIAKLRAEVQALAKELQAVTKELTKIQALTFKDKIIKVKSDIKEVEKQINDVAKKSLTDKTLKIKGDTKEIDKQLADLVKRVIPDKIVKIQIDSKKIADELKTLQGLTAKVKLIPDVSLIKDIKTVIPDKNVKLKLDNTEALKKVDEVIKKNIPEKILKIKTVTDGKETKTANIPDKILRIKGDSTDADKKISDVIKKTIPEKVLKIKSVTIDGKDPKVITDKTFKIKTDNSDAIKKIDETVKKIIPEKIAKIKTIVDGKEATKASIPDKVLKVKSDISELNKQIADVNKKPLTDKTLKIKGDATDAHKKIDEVIKRQVPDKIAKVKTVIDGKEKTIATPDKIIKLKGDATDVNKKIDETIKKNILDKVLKIKTVTDGKETKATAIPDKVIKVKVDNTEAIKKLDEVVKKNIPEKTAKVKTVIIDGQIKTVNLPDKTFKVKADSTDAHKKIDDVIKKNIPDKVLRVKTVTAEGKETKIAGIPDKVVKIKGDVTDVNKKIDDVTKKGIPDKTIKIKTVIDDKTPNTTSKSSEIKIKVDSKDATKKIDDISKKIIPEKVAKVKGDTSEATKKIDDILKKPIQDKTTKIKGDVTDVNKKIDDVSKRVIQDKVVRIKTEEFPQQRVSIVRLPDDRQINVVRTLQTELRRLGNEQAQLFITNGKGSDAFKRNQTEIKNLTKDLQTLKGVTKGFEGKSPLSGLQLLEVGENLTTLAAGITLIAGSTAAFTIHAIELGAELEVLKSSFVGSADDIELFRKATAGTVSEAGLIKLSNQASDLGLSLQDQAKLMSLAKDAADKYGGSVEDNFQKVIFASDGSAKGLRQVGVSIGAFKQEVEKLTTAQGTNIDSMDAEGQQAVRLKAIFNLTGTTIDSVKNKTQDSKDKLDALKIKGIELTTAFGTGLVAGLTNASKSFERLNNLLPQVLKNSVSLTDIAGIVGTTFFGLPGIIEPVISIMERLRAKFLDVVFDIKNAANGLESIMSLAQRSLDAVAIIQGKIKDATSNLEFGPGNKSGKDLFELNKKDVVTGSKSGSSGTSKTAKEVEVVTNKISELQKQISDLNKQLSITDPTSLLFRDYTNQIKALQDEINILSADLIDFQKIISDPAIIKVEVEKSEVVTLVNELGEITEVNLKVNVDDAEVKSLFDLVLEFEKLKKPDKKKPKEKSEIGRKAIEFSDDELKEAKRKAAEEEDRVQREKDARRVEVFQTILGDVNNIASIMQLGAETFGGIVLKYLNEAVPIASSIFSILSFFLKGGIFGTITSLFGAASGGGASPGRSISPGTFVNNSARQTGQSINLRVDSKYMQILQDHLPQYFDRKNSFKVTY